MVEAPIAEQAKRPFTVGIGLVIWNRYCCLRMIGIRYFLHRPLVPIVPQASAWRCILYAKRERASRDDCTWPIDAGILPLSGYIEPWQPAHQKSWSSGRRSEEHTSELQSLMRTSYAVFCLKTK